MPRPRGDVRYHLPRERSPVPALLVGAVLVLTLGSAQLALVGNPDGTALDGGAAARGPTAERPLADPSTAEDEPSSSASGLPLLVEVTFEVGSDDPAGDADAVLGPVVEALRAEPDRRVRVVGHAESSNDPVLEEQLSLRRAETVVGLLVTRGVPRDRADVNAAGATQAGRLVSGTDRRVTVEVVG